MDTDTHLLFATSILEYIGLNPKYAIYAALPTLDREPPHQHRQMFHNFAAYKQINSVLRHTVNEGRIVNERMERKFQPELFSFPSLDYIRDRISDLTTLKKWQAGSAEWSLLDAIPEDISEGIAATLAFTTHLFLDTWNNPVQCFVPLNMMCCFQWDAFDSKNYSRYRNSFYTESSLYNFRKAIQDKASWPNNFPTQEDVVSGLASYLISLGRPQCPQEDIADLWQFVDSCIRDEQLKSSNTQECAPEAAAFWGQMAEYVSASVIGAIKE
jgi:hypothetical protein